jgi:hypothetical protein
MKESEAKKKLCPHMLVAMKLGIIGMMTTPYISQRECQEGLNKVAFMKMENCQGSKCAMWQDRSDMSDRMGHCGLVNK